LAARARWGDIGRDTQPSVVTNKIARAIGGVRATFDGWWLATVTGNAAGAIIATETVWTVFVAVAEAKLFAVPTVGTETAGRTVLVRRASPCTAA
jgi:hypothetical protein